MTEYNVIFTYSYVVEAEDGETAEELAYTEFLANTPSPRDFGSLVEERY